MLACEINAEEWFSSEQRSAVQCSAGSLSALLCSGLSTRESVTLISIDT